MRYRKLSPTGDYVFGQNQNNFLVDSPACVGQAILTRLRLFQGEWYLDLTAGTPYFQQILGAGTIPFYDIAVQSIVLATPGVLDISSYSSNRDTLTRSLTINMNVDTIYGQVQITGLFKQNAQGGWGTGGWGGTGYGQ